jgi:hypothetical protein
VITKFFAVALTLAIAAGCAWSAEAALTVGPKGALLRDGKPYRAIGINYFDCFTRTLNNPADTSYREGFKTLAQYEIPFARAAFGGYYPANWKLYLDDKEAYFKLMDSVVAAADESGVGLIPSLFWWSAGIPDLVGEPCNAWGKLDSKTIAFMRQYVREVVGRYAHSRAIWAWEFGNEYSLAVDIPGANTRPPTPTQFGCPATRTEADDLTSEMLRTAYTAFAEEIRRIDPDRPITTGNSTPRPAASHLHADRSWTLDSPDELKQNLAFVTPDPVNTISIHVYAGELENRFAPGRGTPYAELLRVCLEGAEAAGKPLFVGEFGPPPDNKQPWTQETAKTEGLALLKAIEESRVPLAALWVFDFDYQEDFINVRLGNHRAVYLDAIRDSNRRIQSAEAGQGK